MSIQKVSFLRDKTQTFLFAYLLSINNFVTKFLILY